MFDMTHPSEVIRSSHLQAVSNDAVAHRPRVHLVPAAPYRCSQRGEFSEMRRGITRRRRKVRAEIRQLNSISSKEGPDEPLLPLLSPADAAPPERANSENGMPSELLIFMARVIPCFPYRRSGG